MAAPALFRELKLRGVTLANRIVMAPMCQYSCLGEDGLPGTWHVVHYGARALGGLALAIVEATAVTPEGRISPHDTGIWSDAHVEAFRPITAFMEQAGCVPGIQLAHAGRKASMAAPFRGAGAVSPDAGGWTPLGPSALPFSERYIVPAEMSEAQIGELIQAFADATRRAVAAGFRVVEVHGAHGYAIHSFLSPASNKRTDRWGGCLENRMRLAVEVCRACRAALPEELPLLFRVSATDWASEEQRAALGGAWDLEQTVQLCRALKAVGVDAIDVSSGGNVATASIPAAPGYQVPFAAAIREGAGLPVGAVGLITEPAQAEGIVASGQADFVLLGRELLRNPHWPLQAAAALGVADVKWPDQYVRARPAAAGAAAAAVPPGAAAVPPGAPSSAAATAAGQAR